MSKPVKIELKESLTESNQVLKVLVIPSPVCPAIWPIGYHTFLSFFPAELHY